MSTNPEEPGGGALSPHFLRALESMSHPSTLRNAEQMEAAGAEILLAAMEYAALHPSPDGEMEARWMEGVEALDWKGALRSLEGLRDAAAARRAWHTVYLREEQRSHLLLVLGRGQEALDAALAARRAAELVDGQSCLVAFALKNEVRLKLELGHRTGGLPLVQRALAILGSDSHATLSRARCLVLKARCLVAMGDIHGAVPDLDESWTVLRHLGGSSLMAGAEAGIAGYHEVRAAISWACGERGSGLEHQHQSIAYRRSVCRAPQIERHISGWGLARSLVTLAGMLDTEGRPVEAEECRTEAQSILRALRLA